MSDNALFMTFEGGEGAGKSTQIERLSQYLTRINRPHIITREPGGTEGAEAIRELLVKGSSDKWYPTTELLLHLAARTDHVQRVILPALAEGKIVLCDRFADSTVAYQGFGHQLGEALIQQLHQLVLPGVVPDLTFYLEVPLETGLERASARQDDENRYEKIAGGFHERVQEGFLALAEEFPERIKRLDAKEPIEVIAEKIEKLVTMRLGES